MGKIKKILENELVGGTQTTDVYPITSIKAVYDEKSEGLNHILDRNTIVNISTNYNSEHIAEVLTKEDCIAKVPEENRVLGFQGKYLSSNGWYSISFIGDKISDWNDIEKWTTFPLDIEAESNKMSEAIDSKASIVDVQFAIKDLEKKIGDRIVIEGNVTNNPDEEDISTRNIEGKEVLSFNNRDYNPLSFSGKGYKILRKNLHPVDGTWKNILTQDMINEPNTVYEIRYDFDLDGAEISIKDNCVLKFIGGTLNNGSIICNNTSFLGEDLIDAILKNIKIKGTIVGQHFNFKQNSDITSIIQNLLDVFRYVKIGIGTYKISKTIEINNYNTTIEGSGRHNTTIVYDGEKTESMFSTKKKTTKPYYAISYSSIKNMTLKSNNLADNCIDNQGPSCTFENLHIEGFSKYGIRTENSWCTHINNCIITYCKVGIFLGNNSHNTSIFECRIEHNSIYCILINTCANVNIMNCVLEDLSKTKIYIYDARGINILNNYFEGPNGVTGKEIKVTNASEAFNEETSIKTAIFIGGIPDWNSEQAKYLTIDNAWPSYNINITNNHYEGTSAEYLVCASSCRGLNITNNNTQGKFPVFLLPYVYNVEIYDLEIYNNTSIIAGNNYKALPMNVLYPTNKYYLVNDYSVSHIFGSCKLDVPAKAYIENINDWNRSRSTDKAHYKISNFNENNLEILLNPDESGQYVYSITSNNIIPEVGLYCIDFTFLPVTVIGENSKLVVEILILDNNIVNVATKTINYKLLENEVINSRTYVYIDKINFSGFFIRMSGLKSQEIVKFINPKIYKVGSEIPNIKYFLQPSAPLRDITTSDLYTTGIIPGTVAKYKDTYKVCIKKAENNIDFDIWTDIKNGQNANLQELNTATWFSAISSNNESIKVPVPKQWSQLSLKSSGNYNEKPLNPEIGFAYFCTDKQTTEGSTSGIMIYYKGNNIWVDALGRVVK